MSVPEYLFHDADAIGIKLEVVNGLAIWEAALAGCHHYPNIDIEFPDGSRKRPDISIFCEEPAEKGSIVKTVPDAVIEILSKDYEAKDREIGVPFYRSMSIRDIVLFDPRTGDILHVVDGVEHTLKSPAAVTMQCGCVCLV